MKKVEWKWIEIQKLFNEINVCVISEDAFRQRFAACRSGGFLAPKLLKIPELSTSTIVSKKALNPPFLQTAVVRSGLYF